MAAVSALTFSFSPVRVEAHRRNDRHDAGVAQIADRAAVDARHVADVAQIDRLAVVVREREPLAQQHVGRAEIQRRGPAAEFLDPLGDVFVGFVGQHPLDDVAAWRRRCSGGLG